MSQETQWAVEKALELHSALEYHRPVNDADMDRIMRTAARFLHFARNGVDGDVAVPDDIEDEV